MGRKSNLSPIEQRRNQIEKEVERLRIPKNQKTRRDFKDEEGYIAWQERKEEKLRELREEAVMLESPGSYNEVPMAVVAAELGITLEEILQIAGEGLARPSHEGRYRAGCRMTRDELGRLLEIGAAELLRVANQGVEEVFEDGLRHLRAGDLEAAERTLERIDGFRNYRSGHWSAYETGVSLISGDLESVRLSLAYFGERDVEDLAVILPLLRSVAEAVTPADHPTTVLLEHVKAVADGIKTSPFSWTHRSYASSEYFSQMNENQRHAMFLSNVVFQAIEKYRFQKDMERIRGWRSEARKEEFERVVRNAIYTALEAENTYHESPSSKLFVDKFVELFPKRWVPAEHVELLPVKKETNK